MKGRLCLHPSFYHWDTVLPTVAWQSWRSPSVSQHLCQLKDCVRKTEIMVRMPEYEIRAGSGLQHLLVQPCLSTKREQWLSHVLKAPLLWREPSDFLFLCYAAYHTSRPMVCQWAPSFHSSQEELCKKVAPWDSG